MSNHRPDSTKSRPASRSLVLIPRHFAKPFAPFRVRQLALLHSLAAPASATSPAALCAEKLYPPPLLPNLLKTSCLFKPSRVQLICFASHPSSYTTAPLWSLTLWNEESSRAPSNARASSTSPLPYFLMTKNDPHASLDTPLLPPSPERRLALKLTALLIELWDAEAWAGRWVRHRECGSLGRRHLCCRSRGNQVVPSQLSVQREVRARAARRSERRTPSSALQSELQLQRECRYFRRVLHVLPLLCCSAIVLHSGLSTSRHDGPLSLLALPASSPLDRLRRRRHLDKTRMATTADEETAPLLAPESSGNAPSSPSLSSRLSAALSRPASLNGLEKLLAAIAVFLLLLTATFAGLFAGEAAKLGKEEKHHRKHEHGGHGGVTLTATSTLSGPTATATATPVPRPPSKNVSPCRRAAVELSSC